MPGKAEFANIGEGSYETDGAVTLIPAATVASRYLFWSRTANTNNATQTAANAAPLGTSDDYPDNTSYLSQGIAVKIFGAFKGTTRVVTDGTCTDGNPVKVGAAGQATLWTNGTDSGTNYACGVAFITSDQTSAAGDVISIIPICPTKYFR